MLNAERGDRDEQQRQRGGQALYDDEQRVDLGLVRVRGEPSRLQCGGQPLRIAAGLGAVGERDAVLVRPQLRQCGGDGVGAGEDRGTGVEDLPDDPQPHGGSLGLDSDGVADPRTGGP
jgi:hypothetical protein